LAGIALLTLLLPALALASESWQAALGHMPLGTNVTELNRTNCIKLMLNAFQSNQTVKALVFMPGATDDFFFFRRAKAQLTTTSPTLLNAVEALTNQTCIRATFKPPLLLLHTDEDLLEPEIHTNAPATLEKLKTMPFLQRVCFFDKDWDYVQPLLNEHTGLTVTPEQYSMDSYHFYRHSFAAWNLTVWEALQAISLAGETSITIHTTNLVFEGDVRFRPAPKVGAIPR
jgi:hypothetical protein